ncbi:MAG: 50S ribosomal protein L17 [Microgenomates group bacterium GW2011_GWA2_46_7]|nr:MAG: 50S ribosomal protein L17 [Microgenomates group bacterium GW2011_GWA2_46_7]KKU46702.1 MAG: 50S ribosomal protein L17 [Microgenomates group bacterium GW2011_GWC2_46_7]
MKKRISGYKLNRDSAGRLALLKSLVAAMVEKEEIVTTITRAKATIPIFEKLLTHARRGLLQDRRLVQSYLQSAPLTKRLLDEIAPRYKDVRGGYTKLTLIGTRRGDNATMARLGLTKKALVSPAKTKEAGSVASKKKTKALKVATPEKVAPTKSAPTLVRRTLRRGDK